MLPVNADISSIEVDFIGKPDSTFNRAGAKGLGEVSMVGVAAAVANAVFHATGRRLRDLPIRMKIYFEKLRHVRPRATGIPARALIGAGHEIVGDELVAKHVMSQIAAQGHELSAGRATLDRQSKYINLAQCVPYGPTLWDDPRLVSRKVTRSTRKVTRASVTNDKAVYYVRPSSLSFRSWLVAFASVVSDFLF